MNFSITSGEQSLQVFTATLILSPFCSVQDSLRIKSIWLKLKKQIEFSKVTFPANGMSPLTTLL